MNQKLKYQKPESVDIGKAAAVLGATCSLGIGAEDGCRNGNDPDKIAYCPTGNIATANCYTAGSTAGQSCNSGGTPGW